MNIQESNKLIAEFMGYEYRKTKDIESYSIPFKSNTNVIPELLEFHSSWGWLMPVVRRCLLIAHNEMLNEWENSFADVFLSANIDTMYKEVVDFIKWYNENTKQ